MSHSNLSIALQYDGQYDPAVGAELQQLVATIQQWANGLQGLGGFTRIPSSDLQMGAVGTTVTFRPLSDTPGPSGADAFYIKYTLADSYVGLVFHFPITPAANTTTFTIGLSRFSVLENCLSVCEVDDGVAIYECQTLVGPLSINQGVSPAVLSISRADGGSFVGGREAFVYGQIMFEIIPPS